MRSIRIGIDVGGTHTKAVAIDNETNQIIGKGSVKTTHHHPRGVAQGVIEAFQSCIADNNVDPKEVIFIAHSTTQATNAMLEGDVAKVGVVGVGGGGIGGFLAKRQTNTDDIDLGNQKKIKVVSKYIKTKEVAEKKVNDIIDDMKQQGVEVIVSSKAFGVDDPTEEILVSKEANKKGLLSTSASEITKLYGLSTRTKTAALNASILPTMLSTATSTEESVKESGITVPLMIMRGDGGVMEINEMKKRPILTMLSGPAASVSGALMYLRASNAVFVEVGGTSTDISVIKDGKPAVDYSIIGGHRTYVNSLDVRVTGIAGGSMVRANSENILDVGPRSAHIANLEYAAYIDEPSLFEGAEVNLIKPTPNDPDDYVSIRLNNGESVAITVTCAANALGILEKSDFSIGNKKSSQAAIKILADSLGKTMEQTATDILNISSNKIIPVINDLIDKYKMERDQVIMIGAGGGAGALVRHTAKLMDFNFKIPEYAEVISSIGVALAMVREMVERTVPNPTIEDIASIKKEAKELAIKSGAVEDTIEIYVEIDDQSQKLSAIALGSTEVRTTDLDSDISEDEAKEIALETIKHPVSEIQVDYSNGRIFSLFHQDGDKHNVRIIDKQGFVKVQRAHGGGELTTLANIETSVDALWDKFTNYSSEIRINPDVFIIDGSRLLDYSGLTSAEQVAGLIQAELADHDKEHELYVVATRNGFM